MIDPFLVYLDAEGRTFRSRVELRLQEQVVHYLVSVTEIVHSQPAEVWFSALRRTPVGWIEMTDRTIEGKNLPLFLVEALGRKIDEERK